MEETIRIAPDILRNFGTQVYARAGMDPAGAQLVADTLVQADLWGHQSHGVMRMPWYVARIQSGACHASVSPSFDVDTDAIAVLDGHDGMGQVITHFAMNEAIKRARAHGICAIAVRNSGHFGTAMYYTLQAAHAGCIGFLATNASPAMAPWGGRKKLVGNNPWSWAAPAGKLAPFVLDMANTAVARGKIYLARQRGETVPATWALNDAGVPTTDPVEAIAGMIQPMGGHKGYAISMAMDMLAGVLSGSSFCADVVGPYQPKERSGAGHFMIVLNISAFQPLNVFNTRMERYIDTIKSVPQAHGVDEIFYPGEIEAKNDIRHRAGGIPIPQKTLSDLRQLAGELGLKAPA
jgi:LDH2 family malate/lactate/ureidoglycolate dehydrogenase